MSPEELQEAKKRWNKIAGKTYGIIENYAMNRDCAAVIEKQAEDPLPSGGGMNAVPNKAWEWIIKPLMDDPGLVVGTDGLGMPAFREGATIKVRMKDENKNMLVTLPAQIALWRELAREWQSAGRVCQTKAKSRAADQLMRGDWMSREELAEEQSEVRAIHEKESAEA